MTHSSLIQKIGLIVVVVVLVGLSAFQNVWGGYREGLNAYRRGDYSTALKEFKLLAEKGNAAAQLELGRMYEDGKGVIKSVEKAARWYRRAATQLKDKKSLLNAYLSLEIIKERLRKEYPGTPRNSSIGQHLFKLGKIAQGIDLLVKEALLLDAKATIYMWIIYQYSVKGFPHFDPRILKTIKQLAGESVPRSQYYLGVIYDEGLGVKANQQLALKWLVKSGLKESHVIAARIYIKRGERSKAEKHLNKAAELGSSQGYYNLAMYRQMDGDYTGAKDYFEKTLEIDPNDEKAIVNLGQLYYYGNGVKQDKRKGFLLFLKAARWGEPAAMVNVGSAYLGGTAVAKDLGKAYMWLSLSKSRTRRKNVKELATRLLVKAKTQMSEEEIKEAGHLVLKWKPERKNTTTPKASRQKKKKAQESKNSGIKKKQPNKSLTKGKLASKTVATTKSQSIVSRRKTLNKGLAAYKRGGFATAFREFQPPAERGNAVAQTMLGLMYRNGQGVPRDDKIAVKWYTLAAEQGDVRAQTILGLMYSNGEGVPRDDKIAVKWYTLAAEQGNADAQAFLGSTYSNGQGVPRNDKIAVKWYTLAAEQGNTFAQSNLGGMYALGKGVIQDNVYAHMWWNIAASSGDKNAVKNRDIIVKEMTPADISAAQKLARECVRKKYKGC